MSVEQTKLIRFELTKVWINVEIVISNTLVANALQQEKHCHCTKVQGHVEETLRLIKYATTNLRS